LPTSFEANEEAKRRLQLAIQHNRPVADIDVLVVLRLWPFEPNTKRPNVTPEGSEWVYSSTLGLIYDLTGKVKISRKTVGSEYVLRLFGKWLKDQLGGNSFPWTSISLNKNYAAARHVDKGNWGPSALRAVGDCTGGQLRYWPNSPRSRDLSILDEKDSLVLDARHGVVLFDGNNPHSVEPYTGERFSLVFFTTSQYKKASAAVQRRIKYLGVPVPTTSKMKRAEGLVHEGLGLQRLESQV